jgi:hypothetical protein
MGSGRGLRFGVDIADRQLNVRNVADSRNCAAQYETSRRGIGLPGVSPSDKRRAGRLGCGTAEGLGELFD